MEHFILSEKKQFVDREQLLQFRPPLEEVKGKYYREMKQFINIPMAFRGVRDVEEDLIFPSIIDHNVQGFTTCYIKAHDLFKRVEKSTKQFEVY